MNKDMIINFFITATLVYFALLAYLYVYQREMMYFPDTARPDPRAYGAENVRIAKVKTEDGLDLEGWYLPPTDREKPVLVFFHGNTSHYGERIHKAPAYLEAGYGVLLAGYRGFGGNPGKPTEQGLYQDARAFISWLEKTHHIAPDQIVLYGESLGTGVVVQMATEYDVAAVVLESPYSSTADIAKGTYFFVPVTWLMHDQFRSIDKIGMVKAPLLFFHAGHDTIIRIGLGRKLFEAASEPKTFIDVPEAGHNDLYDHGAVLHVLDFLRNISEAKTHKANKE